MPKLRPALSRLIHGIGKRANVIPSDLISLVLLFRETDR
jgi:hypothetical protein